MRKTSLFAAFLLAFSLLTMAQSVDTIPPPTITPDSLNQDNDWSIRAPLSEEELQKREDNRARIARMKQRLRHFRDTEEEARFKAEQEAAESDFLWSDAEEGGQPPSSGNPPEGDINAEEEEALRLEISRNLQYGKSINNAPSAPVNPGLPEQNSPAPAAYDQAPEARIQTNTADLQRDIKAAFQPTDPKVTPASEADKNWPIEVGKNSNSESQEKLIYSKLAEGESYRLGTSFTDQQLTLNTTSLPELDIWAGWLKQYPSMRVEVRAYTHHEIAPLDAIDLSIQRAKTVTDYWLAQGALEQQLAYRGYGSLSPLVPDSDPEAKQKNERIEVIILELPTR
jgi:outer membrane protein OmpA-like peptidoglycan-associated protein